MIKKKIKVSRVKSRKRLNVYRGQSTRLRLCPVRQRNSRSKSAYSRIYYTVTNKSWRPLRIIKSPRKCKVGLRQIKIKIYKLYYLSYSSCKKSLKSQNTQWTDKSILTKKTWNLAQVTRKFLVELVIMVRTPNMPTSTTSANVNFGKMVEQRKILNIKETLKRI